MTKKHEDIANLAPDIYARSAPKVLSEVYEDLRVKKESIFKNLEDPIFLIIGPGRSVTPDAWVIDKDNTLKGTNRETVRSQIKNGKIILMDYSYKGLRQSMSTLRKLGFFDTGYFKPNSIYSKEIPLDPEKLQPRTITPLVSNLRNKLNLVERCIDLTEISLCAHHATPTHKKSVEVFRNIYKASKPGGKMILAEGNVSMSDFTEKRALQIARDLVEIEEDKVFVFDEREGILKKATASIIYPAETYDYLPEEMPCYSFEVPRIKIRRDGSIRITGKSPVKDLIKRLKEKGNTSAYPIANSILIPLRDITTRDGKENQKEIDQFYDFILRRSDMINESDNNIKERLNSVIAKERIDAICGSVEFYRSRENTIKEMGEAGWLVVNTVTHAESPFYSAFGTKLLFPADLYKKKPSFIDESS
jgi:hypothetical protein